MLADGSHFDKFLHTSVLGFLKVLGAGRTLRHSSACERGAERAGIGTCLPAPFPALTPLVSLRPILLADSLDVGRETEVQRGEILYPGPVKCQ